MPAAGWYCSLAPPPPLCRSRLSRYSTSLSCWMREQHPQHQALAKSPRQLPSRLYFSRIIWLWTAMGTQKHPTQPAPHINRHYLVLVVLIIGVDDMTYRSVDRLVSLKFRVMVHTMEGLAKCNTWDAASDEAGVNGIEAVEETSEPRLGIR